MGFLDALTGAYNAFDQRFGPQRSGPSWRGTADMHGIADDYEKAGDAETAAAYRQMANRNYLAMLKTEGER